MRAAAIYGTLGTLVLTATTLATTGTPATARAAEATARTVDTAPPPSAATPAEQRGAAVAAKRAADQGVEWGRCPAVEHLPSPAQCGTVRVPVDYAKPEGKTLKLTVSRVPARGTKAKETKGKPQQKQSENAGDTKTAKNTAPKDERTQDEQAAHPVRHAPVRGATSPGANSGAQQASTAKGEDAAATEQGTHRAADDDRLGALVYNPGGPGASGMQFALYGDVLGGVWKKLNRRWDLVGYAPRGVGRSAPLSCQDPKEFVKGPNSSPRRPSTAYKERRRAQAAAYARGCAKAQGDRLAHYTTADNARDLEVLRAALGERKLSYFGASYGTYLGSVYATLFPAHVGRFVLDSVVDPTPENVWYRANLQQNEAFERRWSDWKRWVAGHHDSYRLGRTEKQVQRSFDAVRDAVEKKPAGTVGPKELLAAYLVTGYADSVWAEHAEALAEFRKGHPKALKELAAPEAAEAVEEENGQAVYNAVECADAPWPRAWWRWDTDTTASDSRAPFASWENTWMNLPCASWPRQTAHQPLDVRTNPGELPDILLLAATRDAATPYAGALETQRRLPGASLVTESGAGTHGVADGNTCVDRHLAAYLLDGKTPGMRAECEARAEPKPKS